MQPTGHDLNSAKRVAVLVVPLEIADASNGGNQKLAHVYSLRDVASIRAPNFVDWLLLLVLRHILHWEHKGKHI